METLFEGMKESRDWFSLFAAVGNLSLAVTAALAGRKSALSRPVATLAFVLFGWNFSVLVHHLLLRRHGGGAAFAVLDAAFTALSPPLVLDVVLAFAGQTRRRRAPRAVVWLAFGALVAGAFVRVEDDLWAIAFLAAYVPTFAFEVVVLGRHLAAAVDPREKARARVLFAALAVGGSFSASDSVHAAGFPLPYLGSLGTLIAAALLATLVLRLELFERNVPLRTGVYALGMIVAFVVGYVAVLAAFAGRLALQLFAVSGLTLLVVLVSRELALARAETRARTQRLAVLGRFSAQMSHDVKGPLTALLGAVDVLEGVGDDAGARSEFLGLVAEQAKRIAAVVDRYDRMARVEPQKTLVRLNDVVRAVARAHGVPDDAAHLDLAAGPLEGEADPALIESAVENVVRNAVEATKDAKRVRLETRADAGSRLVIRVVDRGPGMDARVAERATDDFFTTKPEGSGLGLAFARRVLEAHGGTLTLESRPGVGTTVELSLPR